MKGLFLFAFLLLSCNSKNISNDPELPTERIDFFSHKIYENHDIPQNYIAEFKYIKLSSENPKHLLGEVESAKLIDGRLFAMDWNLKRLIEFDTDGNDLGQIGLPGRGPGEYLQVTDFDVDKEGNIIILDSQSNRLLFFNSAREHVRTKELPFNAHAIKILDSGDFMFDMSPLNETQFNRARIVITNPQFEILESYFQYPKDWDHSVEFSPPRLIGTDEYIIHNRAIDDNIYLFDHMGTPAKRIILDFGHKTVPEKKRKNLYDNIPTFENYCFLMQCWLVNDNYLLGTMFDGMQVKTFLMDRTKKEVYLSQSREDLSEIIGYSKSTAFSFLFPGKYDDIDRESHIPEDVKEAVKEEYNVLFLYKLKTSPDI